MDLQLDGLRALVTGGTRGIGRAIVEAFVAEGARVGFCARNRDEVAATEKVLADQGARVAGQVVDVTDGPALAAWVEDCATAFDGIDIVVANVSALAIGNTEASWQASYETDMMGTVRLVNAALPYLERSSAASIVTISSVSGREIDFAAGAYGAMKAALVHYTQGLAFDLAGKGIRANTVTPGNTFFEGGIWDNVQRDDPPLFAETMALNPTGRMGRPAEAANAVIFLASPAAGRISGTNLVADGALTRGVQL